jgi:DnaJ-class molecular chaperone
VTSNYYKILEIPYNATQEEITLTYHRVKKAYSHDSLAIYSLLNNDETHNLLELIEEAYSVISNPEKRRQYDQIKGINHIKPQNNQKAVEPCINTYSNNIHVIKNIVNNRKFSLDYTKNVDFEQEIENTIEFTGALLKKIRIYKNVDISRMSEMTKISKTYLLKIEEESTKNIPALVYLRGFVYQYAKCLKLNPDLIASSFIYRLKKKLTKINEK